MTVETPTGPVILTEEDSAIVGCEWGRGGTETSAVLARAARQLNEYFKEERKAFDLPLQVNGSEFQQRVCEAMLAIPFGQTRTYGEIAADLGVPAQAVGQGCGGNPIPILIPCHRVLGANGLGGFSGRGGVETKVLLLRHEKAAGLLI